MKVQIQFHTEYEYEEAVSFSIHRYRLFPRAGRDVAVRRAEFQTNAGAVISYRRDIFDNEVASCFYPEKSTTLLARFDLHLELQERNPYGFLLDPRALDLPFAYTEDEQRVLAPYLAPEAVPALPFWQAPASGEKRPTIEALVELNQGIRENFGYERREEGVARTPAETVQLGTGACRDFSVLMAAILRQAGIAARLASGYMVETGEGEKRAEGALHAWTEAYLPGAGWLGFDPTNGILCDHHHILAAVGINPEDISPTLGRYYHPHGVNSAMKSSLHLHVDETSA